MSGSDHRQGSTSSPKLRLIRSPPTSSSPSTRRIQSSTGKDSIPHTLSPRADLTHVVHTANSISLSTFPSPQLLINQKPLANPSLRSKGGNLKAPKLKALRQVPKKGLAIDDPSEVESLHEDLRKKAYLSALLGGCPATGLLTTERRDGPLIDKIDEYGVSSKFERQTGRLRETLATEIERLFHLLPSKHRSDASSSIRGGLDDSSLDDLFRSAFFHIHQGALVAKNRSDTALPASSLNSIASLTSKKRPKPEDEVPPLSSPSLSVSSEVNSLKPPTPSDDGNDGNGMIPRPSQIAWDPNNDWNQHHLFVPRLSSALLNWPANKSINAATQALIQGGLDQVETWAKTDGILFSEEEQNEYLVNKKKIIPERYPLTHPYHSRRNIITDWGERLYGSLGTPKEIPSDASQSEKEYINFNNLLSKYLLTLEPFQGDHPVNENAFPGRFHRKYLQSLVKENDVHDDEIEVIPCLYVDTPAKLKEAVNAITSSAHPVIAVDVEHFQNIPMRFNVYTIRKSSYRGYTALIQISTVEKDFIIDPFPFYELSHQNDLRGVRHKVN